MHSPANLIIKSLVRLLNKSGQQLSDLENNHSGHAYVLFPRTLQKLPQQRPQRSLFRADGQGHGDGGPRSSVESCNPKTTSREPGAGSVVLAQV